MPYRRTQQIQARLDATRERIIAAAVRLLARDGWTALTIAAVAAEAGVATGSVYRHVEDKDALVTATFRRAAARELTVVTAALDGDGEVRDRLTAGLLAFADRALTGRRLAYALLAEPAGSAVEAERLAFRRAYREAFQAVLDEGIATGTVADHDTEVVAAALVGAMGEVVVAVDGVRARVDGVAARVDDLVATCIRAVPFAPRPIPTTAGGR